MTVLSYYPNLNKFPKGAVKTDEEISINCKVKKDNFPYEVFFFIRDDINNTILNKVMNKYDEDNNYIYYNIKFTIKRIGIYFYHFIIQYENHSLSVGHQKYNPTSNNFNEWQLTIYDKNFETPNSFKASIMYQIFPDRFAKEEIVISEVKNEEERIRRNDWYGVPNSNFDTENYTAKDFFMGNLKGINSKLDYLKSLNISTLYLNPIFESAENHRYSTSDYFKIDPYLGSLSDFKDLVNNFRQNNISIVLDGVFSHTGADSIYFNKEGRYDELGAFQSRLSKYNSWYYFSNFPKEYHSWWGFNNLPTLNKDNLDLIEFINGDKGVLSYWDNLGIGGWRLDVADEFPSHFLESLRKSVKSRNKDNIIIGEVWENASNKISYGERRKYLLGFQLDTVMNYPWRNAILNFVKFKSAADFKFEIEDILETYPRQCVDCLMNMLSTHDTNRAMLDLAIDINKVSLKNRINFVLSPEKYNKAKEKFKTASFIQFSLPGVPSIYYGDEIGMYGFSDPFNRKCFTWNNIDTDLYSYIKKLTDFRKEYRAEFLKDFEFLFASDSCISYKIGNLLFIVNLGDKNCNLSLKSTFKNFDILFNDGEITFNDKEIIVSSKSKFVIKFKEMI